MKGQKVGELIDNQREIFANEAKQEAELKRQAAETKAKQDALEPVAKGWKFVI